MTYVNTVNNVDSEYFSMKKTAAIVFCLSLLALATLSHADSKQPEKAARPLPVSVVSPEPAQGYRRTRTFSGVIQAGRSSELSFLKSGRVQKVLVEEGEEIKAGQLLAILDTRSLQAQKQQLLARRQGATARYHELKRGPRIEPRQRAQAEVARLSSELSLARQKFERRQNLFQQGAIPQEQLDEARSRVEVARQSLDSARQNSLELSNGTRPEVIEQAAADIAESDASLVALQVNLEDSELRAPFSGRIAKRLLDEGSVIAAGNPVLILDESGPKEALIDFPASETPPTKTTVLIGDEALEATLLSRPSRIDRGSHTYTARYRVQGGIPGQSLSLEYEELITEPGFWLPLEALTSAGNGLWKCYSVSESDSVEVHSLEVLHRESERVLVRGTLNATDQIIVEGVNSVVPGQQVARIP